MIGYLTAIDSRDLSSTTPDSRSVSAPCHANPTTPIMPRLPSEYETWRLPGLELSAEEKGLPDEIEETVISPVETTAMRARHSRRVKLNPSPESQASQSESTAPLTRAIDSMLKTGHESSSTTTRPARRNTEPPMERMVSPASEPRHENVVVHAVPKPAADVAKKASESPPRTDNRLAKGIERTGAVSPSPVILPQIRESTPVTSSHRTVESHAHQQRESGTIEKSEPSIVVTIGRIEVRAVTSPSQSRPRPERPPMMSLDDYLNQRVRGVR